MHFGTIKRFLGYRRVSTGEQSTAGTSLDGQKEELAHLAASLRAPIVLDFVEVESGGAEKEERRVEVARLLEAVKPGDVVAVSKFDRFTRDLEFAIRKVREILNKGARFVSIAEGEFDRSPEGELKLSIWASIAQMERARIRDRTHGQKVRLRAQGKFVGGLPPFGYQKEKGRDASAPHAASIHEHVGLAGAPQPGLHGSARNDSRAAPRRDALLPGTRSVGRRARAHRLDGPLPSRPGRPRRA
jgi:DNA invertase Pin-like site-specific DNA recombinase